MVLLQDRFPLPSDENLNQIDDDVWLTWLKKNKAQDRFRYERRFRVTALAAVFFTASALLWRLIFY
jgi:hypothetical protein